MAPPPQSDYEHLHEDPVIHQRRWFLLAIMCTSLVMVVMSVAGLNVAIPKIQEGLKTSFTNLQWIVDSYALVFAGLLLPAGALGDRFGRKRALMLGLVIFATGSLISGVGTGVGQVILGRAVTGIGAAFVMPATLSLLTTVFPPEERRKAIAVWAGFAGAGAALGPIVSGALLEKFWWGSTLIVNLPVVAIVLLAVGMFSPNSRDPEATPLDPAGALMSLLGLGSLVFAIIEGPEKGWSDPAVVVAFAVAAVGLTAFVTWERRAEHPMLPLWLFKDRRMSVGSSVITTAFFVMFGLFFLFSPYLQFVRGYSPLAAGLSTLPIAVTLIAIAPRSAVLAERLGTGRVISTGFTLVACGFAVMTVVRPGTPYLVLAGALVLLGAGMSLTAAPSTGNIMSAVPPAKAGVGSAVNDTTREVGGALGIAVLGSISNAVFRAHVNLDGLGLPPGLAKQAKESIGGATGISQRLNMPELATRAGDAYTHAFNVASAAAVGVALAAAVAVTVSFSRRAEQEAVDRAQPRRPTADVAS